MSGWRKRQVECMKDFKSSIMDIVEKHTTNGKFELGTLFVEDVSPEVINSIYQDLFKLTEGRVIWSKWDNETMHAFDFTKETVEL